MVFCQVWIARRVSRSNLAKPQTFHLENPCSQKSGLRCSLVFWMSLYKDYSVIDANVPAIFCPVYICLVDNTKTTCLI